MNKRKLQQTINKARVEVNEEIIGFAKRSTIAAGLSSEGYAGGYRDALDDITLLLNGIAPHRRNYWNFLNQQTNE